ncbi:MAG: ThiF family adenylyltransferase [Actinobacteria bacterium]|nr:ThiF family adenylyltransferase [Actinomycetota bacterium]
MRYFRQVLFLPIGKKGQEMLLRSRIAIIGCGGLGSVIAGNLARAGAGLLKIADSDRLDISNLQRQALYFEEDLEKDMPKAVIAAERLKKINPSINIEPLYCKVSAENIDSIVKGMDIVLDGTDNFQTRHIINKACVNNKIPWIFGSAAASYGMVFDIIPYKTPCFDCIFGDIEKYGPGEDSGNVGILNTIVNVIASIQTTEAIKYLTGNHDAMTRELVIADLWDLSIEKIEVGRSKKRCQVCGL